MINYPIPGSTLAGNVSTAQALAFLKSPAQIARRFDEILADHNFLSHYLLRGKYKMQGGAVSYTPDEATSSGATAETVAPGGEYPLTALPADAAVLVAAIKKGLGSEIADETVGRLQMDPIERAIQLLANDIVSQFDAASLSLILSAVSQTVGGGAWSAANTIVANVEVGKAQIKGAHRGYRATSMVLTDLQWAAVAPILLPLLPREAGNPILAGAFPNILGLDWVTSSDLPGGWQPLIVDADHLGGIGHEDIPSEEYVALATINSQNKSNVEVARFREKNDSTRIQVRKADVPIVTSPLAAAKITGTGL
ncbi:hypothetical protein MicroSTF_14065 [Microbacterium sp. STF-2]|uniref:phage major capsid protein n=1 Tax=Microbacterium sp. STF-2 TaxID=3031132 RepID=UPI002AFF768A|nr:hypothetical protein [Microbacterium sp. STF-2]MEA1264164.1 hypothetical protein [Microbacterium sp. STF-2]